MASAPAATPNDLALELERRVTNRNFVVSLSATMQGAPVPAADLDVLAASIERWLEQLDPELRSGDSPLELQSDSVQLCLRPRVKSRVLRGGGRLIERQPIGFPPARRSAELRRCN
jgi:hypothetical protein